MSYSQSKRLMRELNEILADPIPNVTLYVDPNNLRRWSYIIRG